MKIPLSWLSEHVKLSKSDGVDLVGRLPEFGVEVSGQEQVEGETVLEVEITANRGDLLSIFGMAREAGAVFARKVKEPAVRAYRGPRMRGAVRIDRNSGCRRYMGARIENVRVSDSPACGVKKLRLAGFAAFNNVVDITNYLLAEYGQPLHAFDADRLKGPVHVRRARPGEKISALDGKRYDLADDLVIADDTGPVAIAGVIGGSGTAVTASTRNVFLECAWFEPSTVRRTSRRLGLATESSFRFERHVDPSGLDRSFFKAIQLIEELAGGKLAGIEMAGESRKPPAAITISSSDVERLLGIRVPSGVILRILSAIGCRGVKSIGKDRWKAPPPSYRPDLLIPEDLIEEIARLHGFDRIPPRVPQARPSPPDSEESRAAARIRQRALSLGFCETVHMSFLAEEALASMGVSLGDAIALENPLSSAVSHLRPTLLPGILSTASLNLRRGAAPFIRLFEIGPIFLRGNPVHEELRMAVVLNGPADPVHFSRPARASDFFDLKGMVESLIRSDDCKESPGYPTAGRVGDVRCVPATIACFDETAAALQAGDQSIGCLGRISSATATRFELPPDVYAAEISLSRILALDTLARIYRPLPRFPSIRRDLSIVVGAAVRASEIRKVVEDAHIPNLQHFEIFDLYRGKGIPDGFYAIGLTFIFQSPEQTLSDDEANASRDAVMALLGSRLGAALRTSPTRPAVGYPGDSLRS